MRTIHHDTNEPITVADLLKIKAAQHAANGVKEARPVTGAAAEYKKYLATSKFKLVVYYTKNKHGVYYTQYDKQANKNRRHIPSIDFQLGEGGFMYQNQEIGFLKLVDYVVQNAENIDKALLILNDYTGQQELTIAKFNTQNFSLSQYVNPIFKDYKGQKFFSHLDGQPLRVDAMREVFKY